MKRLNIFLLIHKGLRALLYDTALQLQHTEFTNEKEAEAALEALGETILLFEEHARKEDSIILPAITEYEPSIVDCFESEHALDSALGEQLVVSMEAFRTISGSSEKILAGYQLNTAFVEFMVFNLEHMAKEENIINPILWRYYTDEEIGKIQKKIIDTTEPWFMHLFTKWMLKGINNTEAFQWMNTVSKTAPQVYEMICEYAQKQLSPGRYRSLMNSLSQSALAA